MPSKLFVLLGLGLFLFSGGPVLESAHAKDVCNLHYELKLTPKIRYPVGREKGSKDILTYGFETEYTFDRLEGIVGHYAPLETLIARSEWNVMSPKQRVEWLSQNKYRVFETYREGGGLILATDDLNLRQFLPEKPILDSTGNIELVLKPVNTLEEFEYQMRYINKSIGEGSMQGSVGLSHNAFFLKNINVDPETSVKRNVGMLNFYHEYDVLEKLSSGYERWLKDNTKQVAKSFDHEFLGPMTAIKHDTMVKLIKGNTVGEKFDAKYMEKVAYYDSSFKYIGSTTYRPDIAPTKQIIILEARDAHSSVDVLMRRLVRNTESMRMDRQIFEPLFELKAFDSVADFQKFPHDVQAMLKDLYKAKVKPDVDPAWYQGDMLVAVETFRNFAYPMRDWTSHVNLFDFTGKLEGKVAKAQDHYFFELKNIQARLASGKITKAQASVLIQKEAAFFSPNSGLKEAYDNWYQKNFGKQLNEYKEIMGRISE